MGLMRRFSPRLPQISPSSVNRFEGWYFKVCTAGGESCAFIPGISTAAEDPHAFIQFIDGRSGLSHYRRFPPESFSWNRSPFSVAVGGSRFGADGMDVDYGDGDTAFSGRVAFSSWIPYPAGFLRPGIMGPFGYFGFLECYHGVVSANHTVSGSLQTRLAAGDSRTWNLSGGKGYVEKDWGHSFPRDYVWMQANSFEREDLSVFVSLAAIPFRGRDFPGLIAFVRSRETGFVPLATWNGARVMRMEVGSREYRVTLVRGPWELSVSASLSADSPLQAPVAGRMDRVIKETVDGSLEFTLRRSGRPVLEGASRGAGLEQGGDPHRLAGWFLTGRRPGSR